MSVTQETAFLIETLARAASQIGSTAASAKINQLIVDILPATTVGSTEDALRQDNEALQLELTSLQKSAGIMAENLALLRANLAEIKSIAVGILSAVDVVDPSDDLRKIILLAESIEPTA